MKDQHIKIILKYVKKLAPNRRTPKYTPQYYLMNIMNILNDFNSWRSLIKSKDIDDEKRFHYKTIADIHRLWCERGVYRASFEEIRKKHLDDNDEAELDLFIDSTLIINKYGSDGVGYGHETRKKKFSKITVIENKNNVVNVIVHETLSKEVVFGEKNKIKRKRGRPRKNENIKANADIKNDAKDDNIADKRKRGRPKKAINIDENIKIENNIDVIERDECKNTKENKEIVKNEITDCVVVDTINPNVCDDSEIVKKIKLEQECINKPKIKKIIIQTLEHDIKGIMPALETCGIPRETKINLIGDKGYIMNENGKKALLERNVTLITSYRTNQKKRNTPSEKEKLKQRGSIERKFRSVKQNNRVHVRKDRNMVNYIGFFYLGVIKTFR